MTLVEQGVTNKSLIEYGLRAARNSGWVRPPSAGQFCQWAWSGAEAAAGIPSPQQALDHTLERIRNPRTRWQGAMHHLGTLLDWHTLRRSSTEQIKTAVERALERTRDHWRSGQPFAQPVSVDDSVLLEHDGNYNKPLTPQQRSANQQQLRALMNQL